MTKADLASRVKDAASLSAVESAAFLNAFLDAAAEELKAGGDVSLPGFGRLFVKDRPARKGRNPRTGEALNIPACRTVKFSMAKGLRDAVQ